MMFVTSRPMTILLCGYTQMENPAAGAKMWMMLESEIKKKRKKKRRKKREKRRSKSEFMSVRNAPGQH